jgi:hypothetical protein
MAHLAAALFFTLSLLLAVVAVHVTVRLYWNDILAALRGQHRAPVRQPVRPAAAFAPRQHAAS